MLVREESVCEWDPRFIRVIVYDPSDPTWSWVYYYVRKRHGPAGAVEAPRLSQEQEVRWRAVGAV